MILKLVARPVSEREPDLLAGNENKPLFLRNLTGSETFRIDPMPKWSHDSLDSIVSRSDLAEFVDRHFGADAYLGDVWIGSSEV